MVSQKNRKEIVLDSSVWIAILDKKDSQHKKAEKVLNNITGKVLVTEYILLEVSTVLSQKVSKNSSNDFIKFVISNRDINLKVFSSQEFNSITSFYLTLKNKRISFVDCSLIWLSKVHRVISFDKDLNKELK
ncbi:MAG: PIN domain-containing protein [Candidatus Paceibacterota bacterium]